MKPMPPRRKRISPPKAKRGTTASHASGPPATVTLMDFVMQVLRPATVSEKAEKTPKSIHHRETPHDALDAR
jgi:hypothetical protein